MIAGSASEANIKLLLSKKFNFDSYDPKINEYNVTNSIKVVINCGFHKNNFDIDSFKRKYSEIQKDLKEIICLENLNPRPETMLQDMNILRDVFTTSELRNKMIICFTSSSPISLKEIQHAANEFNHLFDSVLMMQSESKQKQEFISNNIKTLDSLEPINLNKK